MILEILILLCILGAGTSYLMITKRAPVFSSLASLSIWLVVGFGATSIDLVTDSGSVETAVASEPGLVVLAFTTAGISFLVLIDALRGNFSADERDVPDFGRPDTQFKP